MKNPTFPIVAVGIGPGDMELITVKGLKALQKAEVVFYPISKKTENGEVSFSKAIIDQYQLTAELRPLHIPMTGKGQDAIYRMAFTEIKSAYLEGKRVAVVSEGDLLFYSTFGYILPLIQAENIPTELIPGIPAFILGGAATEASLVDGKQAITVLPRPESFEHLEEHLASVEVLVVMKMSLLKGWADYLTTCNRPFFYCEKLGTPDQFITSSAEELKHRDIPYFSIIIFKKA